MVKDYVAYVLTHVETQKVYIGSSSNLKKRIADHLARLKIGTHHNLELQTLFDNTPEITFTSKSASDLNAALNMERDLIEEYRIKGLAVNVILDPTNPSPTNLALIEYRRSLAKPVMVDGIKYDSVTSAAKRLGLSKRSLHHKLKSIKNMDRDTFYIDDPKISLDHDIIQGGATPILINGEYMSLTELSRRTGIGHQTLSWRKRMGVPDEKLHLPLRKPSKYEKISQHTGLKYSKVWYEINANKRDPSDILQGVVSEFNMEKRNVEFVIGTDIFKHDGDLYLITVNCLGVAGAGLAKSFKEAHPDLYQKYRHDCKMKMITIGNPTIYQADNGKRYMMFPTKDRWQDGSQPDYISAGLQWMVDSAGEDGDIDPKWKIVIPPLGCANGGLSFTDVRETIKLFGEAMPNPILVVYPPWMEVRDQWD